MLHSFLPSFPVCGPVVYVTPTSLQLWLTGDGAGGWPPSLSPSSHLAPLSPAPPIPLPCPRVSGEDEAAPLHWELNGLNGDSPFSLESHSFSSVQFFCDLCFFFAWSHLFEAMNVTWTCYKLQRLESTYLNQIFSINICMTAMHFTIHKQLCKVTSVRSQYKPLKFKVVFSE